MSQSGARLEAKLPIADSPIAAAHRAWADQSSSRFRPATAADAEAPDVSVCIANWNCRDMLRDCLGSLLRQDQGVRFEVIVVDNGSHDGAAEMVAAEFPEVILHQNQQNLGFSCANNQAADRATGRYLFFLNNDTLIPPGTLGNLVRFADEHPEAGIIGPRLRDARGRTQVSYRLMPTPGILLHRTVLFRWTGLFRQAYVRYRREQFDELTTREVEVLMGAAMLLPRDVFTDAGGWDEDFVFGGEDLELSERVGRSHAVMYHPQVEITHFGRVSTRQHIGYAQSNMNIGFLHYLRKSGHSPWTLLAYKVILTLDAPIQITFKAAQYCWRRLTGRRNKAAKSLLAMRGTTHFLTRGLGKFWRA